MTDSTFKDIASYSKLEPLSDDEIEEFFNDIDQNGDGHISFEELEAKLTKVYEELAPEPKKHHLHHPSQRAQTSDHADRDVEKADVRHEHDGLHAFLCALLPDCSSSISKAEFKEQVRAWNVPSPKMTSIESESKENAEYEHRMTWYRKVRAHASVEGLRFLFAVAVFFLTLGFFLWQGLYYNYNTRVRAALGWGVVMAKFSAGAIYPLLFFTVLSMSRWFSTALRRFYWLSRIVDWDLSQSFHIWMAYTGLLFANLHAIGHLTGTFLTGSRPSRQAALAELLGPDQTTASYSSFVRKLPGWSGIVALGLYWLIALGSLPQVRTWSYEVFQLSHLLMFPFLGLLVAHGTAQVLQHPMLGYWLAVPILLVMFERTLRVLRGFHRLPARIEVLDDETVCLTIKRRNGKDWKYTAGQYVFLQVPQLSFFQWHPFTISACIGNKLQLHIKTDGDWTGKLRDLEGDRDIEVGIDGPFGAPAQRFYDFDRSLIIGAGVGITPFSAIVTDLEQQLSERKDPWERSRRSSFATSRRNSRSVSRPDLGKTDSDETLHPTLLRRAQLETEHTQNDDTSPARRRVDFHWTVRDRNHLLWFSSLLNRAHDLAVNIPRDQLELNIATHITMRRKNISTHVFRYLLDAYRTRSSPVSALTGLKTRSHFGRPDFEAILTRYYTDEVNRLKHEGKYDSQEGSKVGVFFCGSPVIGRILSDTCSELTTRGRAEGSFVRFVFMMEVFN